MCKSLQNILFFLCLLFIPCVYAQRVPKYSVGCQLNIGFSRRPDNHFGGITEETLDYSPLSLSFAIEGSLNNMYFAKLKLTNLSYTTETSFYDGFIASYQENTNLIQFALGYNFLNKSERNMIRMSLCFGNLIFQKDRNRVIFGKEDRTKTINGKLFYGLEATYRYDLGYNIAVGFEFNYGRANYVDKYFFSNTYQEVFYISALVSYTLKSK